MRSQHLCVTGRCRCAAARMSLARLAGHVPLQQSMLRLQVGCISSCRLCCGLSCTNCTTEGATSVIVAAEGDALRGWLVGHLACRQASCQGPCQRPAHQSHAGRRRQQRSGDGRVPSSAAFVRGLLGGSRQLPTASQHHKVGTETNLQAQATSLPRPVHSLRQRSVLLCPEEWPLTQSCVGQLQVEHHCFWIW